MVGDAGDPVLRSLVTPLLERDEKLLWVGRPTPLRIVMQRGDEVAGAIFGVILTLVILITFPLMIQVSVPSMLAFLRVMQGVIVLALIFSLCLPVYRYSKAQGIVYGLTDRRALLIQPTLAGKTVKSFNQFEPIERHERPDGSGDLTFGSEPYNRNRPFRSRKIGFFGIANVREVERLMLENFSKPLKTSDEH